MRKGTLFFCLLAFCTQEESKAEHETYSNTKTENLENIPRHIRIHTGNSNYIITQDQKNTFFFIPKSNSNDDEHSEQLLDEQNSNSRNTIFIVRPSKKKPCDRKSNELHKSTLLTTLTTDDPTSRLISTPSLLKSTKQPLAITHPHKYSTVQPPTQKSPPPIFKTTSNPTQKLSTTVKPPNITPAHKCTTAQPLTDEVPIYTTVQLPHLSTTEKLTSTSSPHTVNPSTPPTNIPTRNPRDPSDYDIHCLYDGMYRANNFTCDQYYVCINGIRYLMDCPYGLVFNDDLKVCDWLENVEGCYPPAFDDFSCPDVGYGVDDKSVLKFRYRDSCSQYIACHKRKPRLLTCKEGNSYDDNSNDCVNFENDSNCRNVEYSY